MIRNPIATIAAIVASAAAATGYRIEEPRPEPTHRTCGSFRECLPAPTSLDNIHKRCAARETKTYPRLAKEPTPYPPHRRRTAIPLSVACVPILLGNDGNRRWLRHGASLEERQTLDIPRGIMAKRVRFGLLRGGHLAKLAGNRGDSLAARRRELERMDSARQVELNAKLIELGLAPR